MQEAVDLLRSCGIELRDGQRPQLHTSTALFRYKLSTALRSTPAATQQVSELVDELLAAHDDITLYLDPVSLAEPQADGGFGQQAESLVRLLLGVDALQPELIRALLDKFSEFVGDQPAEDTQDDMGGAGETKVSVKILRQLRWLDYVVDPAALSEKLLETLGFVTLDMQREIIGNLANIVSDGDNAEVARVLAGMLNESGELMLPILEALGSLGCPAGVLQEARNAVLAHVVSAEPMDLPVMVRFLLQSVAGDQAAATIQRLRRRLDLDSLMLTRPGHASRAGGAQKESAAALLL
ncbi:Fanconi anemia group D2 protein, partial [Coemansia sp. RSA 2603]